MRQLVLLLSVSLSCQISIAADTLLILQRDNLTEYSPVRTWRSIRSEIECLVLSEQVLSAQAASFDAVAGACTALQCLRGLSGCRKCRSARNGGLPLIWARPLPDASSTCWTTIQRRVDATINFNRSWSEYAAGFGQGENGNFWMGLEPLHLLTESAGCGAAATSARCRIRWEFSDWNDTWYWAENANVYIGSAANNYRMNMRSVDAARSNVAQISDVNFPGGNPFSTFDRDNDNSPIYNCALGFGGGWWFSWCTGINANGRYFIPGTPQWPGYGSIYYIYAYSGSQSPFVQDYSMKTFEMLLTVA